MFLFSVFSNYEAILPGFGTTASPSAGVSSSCLGEIGDGAPPPGGIGSSSRLGGGSETQVVELSSQALHHRVKLRDIPTGDDGDEGEGVAIDRVEAYPGVRLSSGRVGVGLSGYGLGTGQIPENVVPFSMPLFSDPMGVLHDLTYSDYLQRFPYVRLTHRPPVRQYAEIDFKVSEVGSSISEDELEIFRRCYEVVQDVHFWVSTSDE